MAEQRRTGRERVEDIAIQVFFFALPLLLGAGVFGAIGGSAVIWGGAGAVVVLGLIALLSARLLSSRRRQLSCREHVEKILAAALLSSYATKADVDRHIRMGILQPAMKTLSRRRQDLYLSVLEEDGDCFRMPISAGHSLEGEDSVPERLPKERSFSWSTVQAREPLYSPDIEKDQRFISFEGVEHPEGGSMFSVPLGVEPGRNAVFNALSSRKKAYGSLERTYLSVIATEIRRLWAVRQTLE